MLRKRGDNCHHLYGGQAYERAKIIRYCLWQGGVAEKVVRDTKKERAREKRYWGSLKPVSLAPIPESKILTKEELGV